MSFYLEAAIARSRLISAGIYTLETAPTTEEIEDAIDQVEIVFEAWLNCGIAVREYTERVYADARGLALTRQYPIVSIVSAAAAPIEAIGTITGTPQPLTVRWTGDTRIVDLIYPYARVDLTYTAGLTPVPKECTQAVYGALYSLITEALGDLGAIDVTSLSSPDLYVNRLELPGGLVEEYKRDSEGSRGPKGQGSSRADQIFNVAAKYRRKIITTVGGR